MSKIDDSAINLNLLPSLVLLLETRNVTQAARRAGVSQSAMSHALSNLREQLGDELLVHSGRSMVLTPRAISLADELPLLLARLRLTLRGEERFDPQRSARTFRIATFDYFELTQLPTLLGRTRELAPNVSFDVQRFAPTTIDALVEARVDLALVSATQRPSNAGLCVRALGSDPFVVIERGSSRARRPLTLEQYTSAGHVLVSLESKAAGVVDVALAAQGRSRRVALRVQSFASAALAVASSDLVCTLPESVARRMASMLDLRVSQPPIALAAPSFIGLWPRSMDRDPAHRWLRLQVFSLRSERDSTRAPRR